MSLDRYGITPLNYTGHLMMIFLHTESNTFFSYPSGYPNTSTIQRLRKFQSENYIYSGACEPQNDFMTCHTNL